MATPYDPGRPPADPKQLASWLQSELVRIAQAFQQAEDYAELRVLHAAPEKLREGMEIEADGSDWDPGSGAGKYVYRSGSWVFIG